ncbi:MAG: pyruvate, phosphate dikinase [Planctomycetes bacterium]|nr:pyruvate, phosphate dikinase [Planctomycetota bacterium]
MAKKTAKRSPKPAKSAGKKLKKMCYYFGHGRCDGDGTMKATLGGKGANLAAMTKIGLPVPPGFTITTEVCTSYYANAKKLPAGLLDEVQKNIGYLEVELGKKFGDPLNPLLVAVRSGSRDSMPGMMDTILNLGLNDVTVEALKKATGNGRFAWDCYRRFVQMYGDVVMGIQKRHENEHEPFDEVMDKLKGEVNAKLDTDLNEADLQELVRRFKTLILDRTGKVFPPEPIEQLKGAVGAVFGSWMNERAILYRQKYKIPDEWGTAVNVQSMVFGNMGDDCATGVAFTRDPATGENVFWGEYLVNAQGEDVVAGVRTPNKVQEMIKDPIIGPAYKELEKVRKTLEKNFGDVQDIEFTIERKKLYMLQTRNGKRTAFAYVRIAHDMVKEKLMTPEHAIRSCDPETLNQLLQPIFDRSAYEAAKKEGRCLTTGLPAGPGAASGTVVFTAAKAEELVRAGHKVLLARVETSPEDLRGMIAAEGILTSRGGVSSHAALVARQMGKVCVAGAGEVHIDYHTGTLTCKGVTIREGDAMSINGSTGEVFQGAIASADSELKQVLIGRTMKPSDSKLFQYYDFIMKLSDKFRTLGLRTNADTPEQVHNAVAFGAQGIGLCRTEHMFFEGDRIDAMRQMILAENVDARRAALDKLLPYQQGDFEGIFRALDGRPACIRLLDPPLHEFLPHTKEQQMDLARKIGVPVEKIIARVHELHEFNPMLGFRGCRLGLIYTEITEMQARAVFQAAAAVLKAGVKVKPEVMIPLVGFKKELDLQVEIVHRVAKEVMAKTGKKFPYQVGTMIEVPRGALTADEIAQTAEFFSFGTNDLTQTTLGMSRDDSGSFLPKYRDLEILKDNPFASIDQAGVGQLMKMAVEKGRSSRPDIKLGICGEHGGDPSSIDFCHRVGLAYVSCSPFRVPVARMAAAQAAIKHAPKKAKK